MVSISTAVRVWYINLKYSGFYLVNQVELFPNCGQRLGCPHITKPALLQGENEPSISLIGATWLFYWVFIKCASHKRWLCYTRASCLFSRSKSRAWLQLSCYFSIPIMETWDSFIISIICSVRCLKIWDMIFQPIGRFVQIWTNLPAPISRKVMDSSRYSLQRIGRRHYFDVDKSQLNSVLQQNLAR